MITGFNTDIEYEGVTYHVQTEDKGRSRPIILSLVYNGGTILASKRSPYDDLLKPELNERILAERLNKQHRLICAAIQAGRLEDLKNMTARESAAKHAKAAAPEPELAGATVPAPAIPINDATVRPTQVGQSLPKPSSVPLDEFKRTEKPIPKPNFEAGEDPDDAGLIDEPIIEAVAIFEDEDLIILPAEAVAVIEEPAFPERPDHNKLCIEILGDVRFRGGERNTVGFLVSRGSNRKVVPDAQIMIKILGSSFRPVIFHAQTDANGVATVNMQMPSFTSGRAAFLVRAIADGEEIELRRSIAHG